MAASPYRTSARPQEPLAPSPWPARVTIIVLLVFTFALIRLLQGPGSDRDGADAALVALLLFTVAACASAGHPAPVPRPVAPRPVHPTRVAPGDAPGRSEGRR